MKEGVRHLAPIISWFVVCALTYRRWPALPRMLTLTLASPPGTGSTCLRAPHHGCAPTTHRGAHREADRGAVADKLSDVNPQPEVPPPRGGWGRGEIWHHRPTSHHEGHLDNSQAVRQMGCALHCLSLTGGAAPLSRCESSCYSQAKHRKVFHAAAATNRDCSCCLLCMPWQRADPRNSRRGAEAVKPAPA